MAARQPTREVPAHPTEIRCRLKMALNFRYEMLNALDSDWLITFQKTNMGQAKPVFWCKMCAFDHTMLLCLEISLNEKYDQADLLQPLMSHQKI